MKTYELSHLSDPVLLRDLTALVARDRTTTAELLAHIAEVDARKLYLPAAYPSMFAWCVGELRLSEDAAAKRIQAARAARRFPVIFGAVAGGRLHLSAVCLLAAHLTEENAVELLTVATHKSKSEVERMLAGRFPRTDMLTWVEAIPAPAVVLSTGQSSSPGRHVENHPAPESVPAEHAPGHVGDRPKVKPLSSDSFALQLTMSRSTHDKLRHAQQLLGHQVPSGDLGTVLDRALDALIERLEKRKFAATSRPGRGARRGEAGPRHIPAHVKRMVLERDGARCTFESETGRRCEARTRLEFDHVLEVARGGEATVSGIRLRCRAHNLYAAECTYGPEFMRHKRIAAAEARAAGKARATEVRGKADESPGVAGARAAAALVEAATADHAPITTKDRDVVPWLRQLGFSASEARLGAAGCEHIPGASLEQRVRAALSCIGVRGTRVGRVAASPDTSEGTLPAYT